MAPVAPVPEQGFVTPLSGHALDRLVLALPPGPRAELQRRIGGFGHWNWREQITPDQARQVGAWFDAESGGACQGSGRVAPANAAGGGPATCPDCTRNVTLDERGRVPLHLPDGPEPPDEELPGPGRGPERPPDGPTGPPGLAGGKDAGEAVEAPQGAPGAVSEAARAPEPPSGPAGAVVTGAVVTRHRSNRRQRTWAVVDLASRRGATLAGPSFRVPAASSGAGPLLAALPEAVEDVFLVGAPPKVSGREALGRWGAGRLGEGWAPSAFRYGRSPVLTYTGPGGRRVNLARTEAWFPGATPTLDQATEALRSVAALVGERFGCALMATPAQTGLEAFAPSIPFQGHAAEAHAYEALSVEEQELIRTTSTQHRQQFFAPAGDTIPRLEKWDIAWAYADHLAELPTGPASRSDEPADQDDFLAGGALRYTPGRFRVRFEVPADWAHVGLLGVAADGHWAYPSTPGEAGECWADGCELALAADQGWRFAVVERLGFTRQPGKGPLYSWGQRLIDARATVDTLGLDEATAGLARAAIRNVLIFGLGAFMGRPIDAFRLAPRSEEHLVPADARREPDAGDYVVWREQVASHRPELAHPEWPHKVYARCRVRVLAGTRTAPMGALHVAAGDLLDIYGDAIYLTCDPGWRSVERVGRLRRQKALDGPLPAPATRAQMLALTEGRHGD